MSLLIWALTHLNELVFDFEYFIQKDQIGLINEVPIRPQELRVVCDNMLGGLAKELRRCGVDTVILENNREHTDVARVCPVKTLNKY